MLFSASLDLLKSGHRPDRNQVIDLIEIRSSGHSYRVPLVNKNVFKMSFILNEIKIINAACV